MSFFYSADDDDPQHVTRRPLLVFILVTLVVGAGASIFSDPAIPTWYAGLTRPVFAPPNWLFSPVWTALYVLMAIAAWRVWKITGLWSFRPERGTPGVPIIGSRASYRGRRITIEMGAYAVQLALNFAWSAIFFSLHRIGLALVEILILDGAILVTAALFFRRERLAGLLMLPYLGWTLFASLLTHAFWRLNG